MKNNRVFTDMHPFIWDNNTANSVAKFMNAVVNARFEQMHPEVEKMQKLVEDVQFDILLSADANRLDKLAD